MVLKVLEKKHAVERYYYLSQAARMLTYQSHGHK